MYAKRTLDFEERPLSVAQRFRLNIGDLFLGNDVSGSRARSIYRDANAAGTRGVADVAAGSENSPRAHRDLLRRLLRTSQWPKLYEASIRVYNKRSQQVERAKVPMLLPHVIMAAFNSKKAAHSTLFTNVGLDGEGRAHLHRAIDELKIREGVVALGLWMDGVVTKWDRSSAHEMVTLNFPGFQERNRKMRIPLCVFDASWRAKGATWDDVLEVMRWSLRQAAIGRWATRRHDGSGWLRSDAWRAKHAGEAIGCRGILTLVTGDGKMYKDLFRFPAHNENAGICWMCSATPITFKQTALDAPWRNERLQHWGLVARMRGRGLALCPLFNAPCFRAGVCRVDWLHAMDLGVTADWIGQCIVYLLPRFPGGNQDQRIAAMWARIQLGYRQFPPHAKLDNLTGNMLSLTHAAPQLRAYGSEVRGLVPIIEDMATDKLAGTGDPTDATVLRATRELSLCYAAMVAGSYDELREHSRKFATIFVSLENALPGQFRVKPKMHMMQEMCEMAGHTSIGSTSTYRDEEFGGSVVAMGRRRGGHNTAASVGRQTLLKLCARFQVPRV